MYVVSQLILLIAGGYASALLHNRLMGKPSQERIVAKTVFYILLTCWTLAAAMFVLAKITGFVMPEQMISLLAGAPVWTLIHILVCTAAFPVIITLCLPKGYAQRLERCFAAPIPYYTIAVGMMVFIKAIRNYTSGVYMKLSETGLFFCTVEGFAKYGLILLVGLLGVPLLLCAADKLGLSTRIKKLFEKIDEPTLRSKVSAYRDASKLMNKKVNSALIFVALTLVVVFFICGGLNMYALNASQLWFTAFDILPGMLIAAVLLGGLVVLIGRILPAGCKTPYIYMVLGLSVAFYIQYLFMNVNYGVMNGSEVIWEQYKAYAVINSVVWAVCLLGPAVFALIKKKTALSWLKGIRFVACLMILANIVSTGALLLTTCTESEKNTGYTFTQDEMFTVGSEENIVVFLLDMFDQTYFEELLEQEPELSRQFDGFTYFDNATGSYSTTLYGMLALFTGQTAPTMEIGATEYSANAFANTDFYEEMSKSGYIMDIYSAMEGYMSEENCKEYVNNYAATEMQPANYGMLSTTFYRFVACRYFPHIAKQSIWMTGEEFDSLPKQGINSYHQTEASEYFYPLLQEEGLQVSDGKRYKFYHLRYTHYNYYFTEDAQYDLNTPTSAMQSAKGALKVVNEYCEKLKELGLYDDTAIVIVADHGYVSNQEGAVVNPIFMVKPKAASGALEINSNPVSHLNFLPTLAWQAGINEDGKYGLTVFEEQADGIPNRYFYSYRLGDDRKEDDYNGMFYTREFLFPDESNDPSKVIPTGRLLTPYGVVDAFGYKKYILGEEIRLTRDDKDTQQYFDYGIADLNWKDEIWLQNRQACFSATLENYGGGDLTFRSILGPEYMPESQDLRIYCGDTLLFEDTFIQSGEREISFTIPAACVKDGKLVLRFETPDGVPEILGTGHCLAIQIQSFTLSESN